jgi:hypothetical protein
MTAIPDINVLLYAVDSKSPFHKPSMDWLNGALNGDEHDGEVASGDSDFGKFPGLKWFNPVTGVRVGR